MKTVCSVTRDLCIEEGTIEDYKQLAEFHYRNPETHPLPLKIFTLKRNDETSIGVIMYAWPPLNIFGRRKAIGRHLTIKEINEKIAIISRVILHPKYRSIGLGERLVKETLPIVGRPYVETIAVMAHYNPFFEKAGMTKIAETNGDKSVKKAAEELEALGFKPYTLASAETNLFQLRNLSPENVRKVRKILLEVSQNYYKRLSATGKAYPKKNEFNNFIAKATLETLAKVISRLAVLAQTKVYLLWKNSNAQCT